MEVNLESGHPAEFSANGSHGVWAQEGKHTYLHILTVHLDDFCSRGSAWDTWQNLEILKTGPWDSAPAEAAWVDFRGDWGNQQKIVGFPPSSPSPSHPVTCSLLLPPTLPQGCELEPLFGECGLVGGPSGPHKYFNHDMVQPPTCA